jgi:pimeloyl-ACP methyl ester carboxylesterase
MALDRSLFAVQQQDLATGFRTIAYDLRARTSAGEEPYGLYDLVTDFETLLDRRGVESCVLVGMSMGGFLAVRAAMRLPDRIRGVVLIGSSGIPYEEKSLREWRPRYEALARSSHIPASEARIEAELHFSRATRSQRPDLIDEWSSRIASRSGQSTWCEFAAWAEQDDLSDQLSLIATPVLVVHGEEDPAVPLEMALETYRRLANSHLLVIPFASHAVNLEAPVTVNNAIRTFAHQVFDR